jgi:hypothetical protein
MLLRTLFDQERGYFAAFGIRGPVESLVRVAGIDLVLAADFVLFPSRKASKHSRHRNVESTGNLMKKGSPQG